MKTKVILFGFVVALVGFIPPPAFPQQDEDVRGAFLTTRPKATAGGNKRTTSVKPSRKRPKATATKPAGSSASVKKEGPIPAGGNSAVLNVPRIGLGLTLFMRNSSGLAVRTDTSRQFLKGDHVRFLIETNSDGYLYVFNTTDGGKPVMIYPDPELDEAGNYFQSHVPFEIPSSLASEERLRWLTFDEHPGA